ncbi:type 1 fimbrial protein [Vibrio sp. ZSDZ65]|uniref:Type 1 fimbrial protein n=1 Tax=Vibrio qingdaonensis TaxID=2829491 RepID=A0A9X3HX50_9VIBR|nr:fimbrial protein [Vibrio qingdaonensis]MCW8346447.1 type 1 fimbrial protein [Vibrio qingdaonensis]
MKKNTLCKSIIASSILLISAGSYANDGQITFNGKVTAASCQVSGGTTDGTATETLSISMPSITTDSIDATSGALSGHTSFNIQLTNCQGPDEEPIKARVAFSGIGDPDKQYALKNTAANAAQGVGIQLLQEDGTTKIDINGGSAIAPEETLPLASGTAVPITFNFQAAYINVTGNKPTAGDVLATAKYVIEYN